MFLYYILTKRYLKQFCDILKMFQYNISKNVLRNNFRKNVIECVQDGFKKVSKAFGKVLFGMLNLAIIVMPIIFVTRTII